MFAGFHSKRARSVGHRSTQRPRRVLPQFQTLEDRTLFSAVTVMNLNDSGAGSLRAALAAANSGDTIMFAHGLHGTINLASELQIANSLTIDGPGANRIAVSGDNASRVFEVDAGFNVTINDLTISHGYAPNEGGGILNDGSNLTLSGDQLTQNVAYGSVGAGDTGRGIGGGLENTSGNLTVTDCQITDNQALGAANSSEQGDGDGGGLALFAGSNSITNSIISGNLVQGGAGSLSGVGAGGGIVVHNGPGSGTLVLTNSTISDNRAVGGNNSGNADGQGGGLAGGSVSISQCTFSGNVALGGNGGTGPNVGEAEGAAIGNFGQESISNSRFDNNQAIGGNNDSASGPVAHAGTGFGAGVFSAVGGSASFVGPNTLTVTNSLFIGNTAQGGDHNTVAASVFGLAGVGTGGAIMNYAGGAATVSGTALIGNQAIGGDDNTATGNGALQAGLGAGGGIFNALGNYNSTGVGQLADSVVTVSNCIFAFNQAQACDGSALGGGIYNGATATLSLANSLVTLNSADGAPGIGGGVYSLGTFTHTMTPIVFNFASTSGDNIGP